MIAKSHQARVGEQSFNVFPSQPETVQALWSALPPDLRLALAKTAPRVAGRWAQAGLGVIRRCQAWTVAEARPAGGEFFCKCTSVDGTWWGDFLPTLASAQSACDAALIAQGYVLDGGDER